MSISVAEYGGGKIPGYTLRQTDIDIQYESKPTVLNLK